MEGVFEVGFSFTKRTAGLWDWVRRMLVDVVVLKKGFRAASMAVGLFGCCFMMVVRVWASM